MKDTIIVPSASKNQRLDLFLGQHFDNTSRSQVQKWIKAGFILLNGKKVTPHIALSENDTIEITNKATVTSAQEVLPPRPDLPLDIIFEDEDILVINKPAGQLVHPAITQENDTLANAVLAHAPSIADVGDSKIRPGIVQRLDKDASGIIVVAKTKKTYNALKKQFQNHTITKEYTVLVEGTPPLDEGTITLSIGRSKSGGKMAARHQPKKGDRDAITHYRVLKRFPKATLLTVRTETGRTHQIRVHFNALGCPLVGDPLYKKAHTSHVSASRLFLHATTLGFTHPQTKKLVEFHCPLPQELENILSSL